MPLKAIDWSVPLDRAFILMPHGCLRPMKFNMGRAILFSVENLLLQKSHSEATPLRLRHRHLNPKPSQSRLRWELLRRRALGTAEELPRQHLLLPLKQASDPIKSSRPQRQNPQKPRPPQNPKNPDSGLLHSEMLPPVTMACSWPQGISGGIFGGIQS